MMILRVLLGICILQTVTSCNYIPQKNAEFASRRQHALKILKPFLQNIENEKTRYPANTDDPSKVKVFLPSNAVTEIAAPTSAFANSGFLSVQEIEVLKAYLRANRAVLGSATGTNAPHAVLSGTATTVSTVVRGPCADDGVEGTTITAGISVATIGIMEAAL